MSNQSRRVVLGKVSGLHGVVGWIKVYSETSPREAIFKYQPWYVGDDANCRVVRVVNGRKQGKTLVAQLEGIDERDQARQLIDQIISVDREQLPDLPEGEYYWIDLEGLNVVSEQGFAFGKVEKIFTTGSNDVVVVKGDKEYLIPYVSGQYIKSVSLEEGQMVVDWDPDF